MALQIEAADAEELAHLASPLALTSRVVKPFRARAQQKIISDAIVDAVTGRGPRFIGVSVAQQFGKSFITSVGTPTWWLELQALEVFPPSIVGLISNEDTLALSWSRKIQRIFAANQQLLTTRIRKDSRAASFWETETDGGLMAVGIGGSIVGRPMGLIVIDDPTKNADQAASPVHQEQVWSLWESVGIGRLQPWTVVLVVHTRYAEFDLIGRLSSKEYPGDPSEWRFIRLPVVCDSEDDPLGRSLGQAMLRPQADQSQREADLEMERVRTMVSPYTWNALWQQNPVDPEGSILPESKWRYWGGETDNELPDFFDQVVITVDCSFKDTDGSDYVACQAWGASGPDRYLIDQSRGRWSFTETLRQLSFFTTRIRSKYANATSVLIEDKANGPAVVDSLNKRINGILEWPVSDYGSKMARVNAASPLLMAGNLYAPARSLYGWVDTFIAECSGFPRAAHDDGVDAMTMALLYMQKFQYEESALFVPDANEVHHFPRTKPNVIIPADSLSAQQTFSPTSLWVPEE